MFLSALPSLWHDLNTLTSADQLLDFGLAVYIYVFAALVLPSFLWKVLGYCVL